jgi:uncharacterized protein
MAIVQNRIKRPIAIFILAIALALPAQGMSQNSDWLTKAFRKGDYATVLRGLKPLAEQGNAGAQYNLGNMYLFARGVQKDYVEALKWFHQAAMQDHVRAQYNLGNMLRLGTGAAQNYSEAVKWLRKAAEQGYASAQANLGSMYSAGEGVLQDNIRGYMWANLAAAQGNETGTKNREVNAKHMTPSQIMEAKRLSQECVNQNYKNCD